jgi:hypothetical protein
MFSSSIHVTNHNLFRFLDLQFAFDNFEHLFDIENKTLEEMLHKARTARTFVLT